MADDPLEELSRDEKQALVNLVKNDNGFDLSRRDVLALAGGASLGAVIGGTGYSAMGSAKADASTSDSDGNVGLPNDPVDAWIEGLAGPTASPIDLGSDIVPDTDASYDLGSSSNQFNNAYMSNAEVESATVNQSMTDASGRQHTGPIGYGYGWQVKPSYWSGAAVGEGSAAFADAAPLPDGRVVLAPYSSSNVGFVSADGTYTSGPTHGEVAGAFRGAAPLPDGRVVLTPYSSINVGFVSPHQTQFPTAANR